MTDLIHIQFQDVIIRLKSPIYPYYVWQRKMDEYSTWCKQNLKKGTYIIHNDIRAIQILKEDLVMFTLKYGSVYEIISDTYKMTKVEKLLAREPYETKSRAE